MARGSLRNAKTLLGSAHGEETYRGQAYGTPVIPPGLSELRVHGVNGGTAQQNLHDPHPVQVSGDDTAGFYRRREELNFGEPDAAAQRTVEAYNWSSINSKKADRAWWVLLAPFALANLAGWLLPAGLSDGRRRAAQILLRVVGLACTVLAVLSLMLVSVDLVGVQCASTSTCTNSYWLGWLERMASWSFLRGNAGRRAIIFSVVPLLCVVGLWYLGRRSSRYEDYGLDDVTDDAAHGKPIDSIRMDEVEFWQASTVVVILRWMHVAAATGAVATALALSIREVSTPGDRSDALFVLAALGIGVTVVSVIGAAAVNWLSQVPSGRSRRLALVPPIAGGILVVVIAFVGWSSSPAIDAPPLEAVRLAMIGTTLVAIVAIILAGCCTGAWGMFIALAISGGLATMVLSHDRDDWWWEAPTAVFLAIELAIAVVVVVAYVRRGPRSGGDNHHAPTLIFAAFSLMAVAASGVVRDGGALNYVVAGAVVFVVATVIMVFQVRWGNDVPASGSMRKGPAVVVAALAFMTISTLAASGTVLVAERLGTPAPKPVARSELFDGHREEFDSDTLVLEFTKEDDAEFRLDGTLVFWTIEQDPRPEDRNVVGVIESLAATLDIGAGAPRIVTVDDRTVPPTLVTSSGPISDLDSGVLTIREATGTTRDPDEPMHDGKELRIIDATIDLGDDAAFDPPLVTRGVDEFEVLIDGTSRIIYPAEVGWYAVAALAGLAVMLTLAALRLVVLRVVRWRGKWRDLEEEYDRDLRPPGTHDPGRGESQAKRAARSRWLANITDDADWILSAAVYATFALMLTFVSGRLLNALPDNEVATIIGFASWLFVFVWIALFWVLRQAKENRGIRRTVGMLWDVTAFFPRRFHPLAPPCYAERSVLDVRDRIIRIRNQPDGDGRLVIVAHSQGTLVVTAALLSLLHEKTREDGVTAAPGSVDPTTNEFDRLALVTYGCMIQRIYGRAWPDQLRIGDLIALKKRLGDDVEPAEDQTYPLPRPGRRSRWQNFGRYTDYLGGRVFAPLQRPPTLNDRTPEREPERRDDVFFRDPTRRWRYEGQHDDARVWMHSFDYESDAEDPRFREHVWGVATEL